MAELRVLVVDDEPLVRKGIRVFLGRETDVRVLGEARNGEEAIARIRELRPDLVLLDVQMPGMDGLAVVPALAPEERPAIVFVTACSEYAIKAFDLHAVDYLLKPFDGERFAIALRRARARMVEGKVDRLELASIMRKEPIDLVATDYSIGWRGVEETILPLAQERKIGFMAHFTFDRGRTFRRVVDTPLPAWAAEFDAKTWAQFFLKYVISHPDVTVARTGTTKAAHMLENLGAGIGRLPNASMRKRMAEFVDALPLPQRTAPSSSQGRTVMTPELAKEMDAKLAPTVALPAATLDRYAGEYTHAAVGTTVTIRRAGDRLVAEVHGSAMTPIPFVARSETRFASASIYNLEFQLDGQGNVTGATWEQLKERIALQRR